MRSKRQRILEKAVMRGKYVSLYNHLNSLTHDRWEASFDEVEEILGFDLPDSARIHRPWWANQGIRGGHSHAFAWEMAGWKTSQVDMDGEKLIFIRK